MNYLLKEEVASEIKSKFRNNYIANKLNLSNTYVSLIMNRRRTIQKHMAFAITKTIDLEAEVEDLFEIVK